MKHRSKAVPLILLAALLALLLGSACVRLNEPAAYRCDSDADCDSSEVCSTRGLCRSNASCDFDSDCRNGRICAAGSCTAPQCTQPGQCGAYACELGRCATYCGNDSDCRPGATCLAGQCVEAGSVADEHGCYTDAVCESKHCCPNSFGGHVCRATCLKSVGETCSLASECASNVCCATIGERTSRCSAVPCAPVPECATDLDCRGGRCAAGKCVALDPQKTGARCSTAAECQSAICQANTCRAATANPCAADLECETGHVCCPSPTGQARLCSGGDGKCAGGIGAPCFANQDCGSGRCNDGTWCTMNCTTNAECGVSPWGDPNACETNGLGAKICFAGCSSAAECRTNLGTRFSCYPALDSAASICAIN